MTIAPQNKSPRQDGDPTRGMYWLGISNTAEDKIIVLASLVNLLDKGTQEQCNKAHS
jgi:hypothetical protein